MDRRQPTRRDSLRSLTAGTIATALPAVAKSGPSPEVIDTNVSLFQWPFRRVPNDLPAALSFHLTRLGITEAWAGSFEAILHRDISSVNKRLANACRRYPLFRPVAAINPVLPGWERDLRLCKEEHRMHAVRLVPGYHRYALTEPFVERLLRQSAAKGMLVQIAVTLEDERTQHPSFRSINVDLSPLADLVSRVPRSRIQILNLRGRVPRELQALNQIYFDTSRADSTDGVPKRISETGANRVLLGTHAPLLIPAASLIRLHESGQLSGVQLTAVTSANARQLTDREAA